MPSIAECEKCHLPQAIGYAALERILDEGLERYHVKLFRFQLMPDYWHLVLRLAVKWPVHLVALVDETRPATVVALANLQIKRNI